MVAKKNNDLTAMLYRMFEHTIMKFQFCLHFIGRRTTLGKGKNNDFDLLCAHCNGTFIPMQVHIHLMHNYNVHLISADPVLFKDCILEFP